MTPEEIGLLLDSGPTEEVSMSNAGASHTTFMTLTSTIITIITITQLIFKRSGMPPPGAGGGQQQGGGPPKEIKFIPTQTGGA